MLNNKLCHFHCLNKLSFFFNESFFLVNKMSENSEKLAALLFDREKEQIFGTNAKISGT